MAPPPKPPQQHSMVEAAAAPIAALSQEHKFALGGMLALLLGKQRLRWSEAFTQQTLRRLSAILKLSSKDEEVIVPLMNNALDTPEVGPEAFVMLLPPEVVQREACLLSVLLLIVADEQGGLGGYDARVRQLLMSAATALGVPCERLASLEASLALSMRAQLVAPTEAPPEVKKGPSFGTKWKKRVAIGVAGVASGAAIALTAGLAAPAVIGGIAALGGGISGIGGAVGAILGAGVTATAAMLSGAVGLTVVTTIFGAAGTGLAAYKMEHRLGELKEFEFRQPPPPVIAADEDAGAAATSAAAAEPAAAAQTSTRGPVDISDAPAEVSASSSAAMSPAGAAPRARAGASDGLLVCICISGWLVGSEDTAEAHWWGSELGKEEEEEGEEEAAAAARRRQRKEEKKAKAVEKKKAKAAKKKKSPRGGKPSKATGAGEGLALMDLSAEAARDEGGEGEAGVAEAAAADTADGGEDDEDDENNNNDEGEDSDEEEDEADGDVAAMLLRRGAASRGGSAEPAAGSARASAGSPAEETSVSAAAWLVEMGFPAEEVRSAAAAHRSVEAMLDSLLARGVTPSVDAAAGGGGGGAAEATSANPSTPLLAADGPRAAASDSGGSGAAAAPPPAAAAATDGGDLVAGDPRSSLSSATDGSSAAGSARSSSAEPSPLSPSSAFVRVERPKATALECLPYAEHHVLVWESKQLRVLGNALGRIAASEAVAVVSGTVLKQTFLASLMAACAMPAYLMKACSLLDNPWAVAFERSKKTGKLLAEVLLQRVHGARPVVLVGFGLGARVIYEVLLRLAAALEAGDGRAAGVVQHVVFMGLPAADDEATWRRMSPVVAGRLINCYRPHDLVLSLVYRSANLQTTGVAGLGEVQSPGVENFDVGGVVTAHHKYRHHVGDVLQLVGVEELC